MQVYWSWDARENVQVVLVFFYITEYRVSQTGCHIKCSQSTVMLSGRDVLFFAFFPVDHEGLIPIAEIGAASWKKGPVACVDIRLVIKPPYRYRGRGIRGGTNGVKALKPFVFAV